MGVAADYEAVVVGAGFGGMGAAIQLRRMGIDNFTILERADDLGGTWHVNRYPGLAVDIASVTYSFSFEPNPHWSRLFAPGAELEQYANRIADKYDLRKHMRFHTAVDGARWDDEHGFWVVTTAGGESVTGRYLITATGYLSQPRVPEIEGIDGFAGRIIHTTDWDRSFDPSGRRIGLIGTGATAVQLIPELARDAAELTVYQRTPIWVVPKVDFAIPKVVQRVFAAVPFTQRIARFINTSLLELLLTPGAFNFRQARFLTRRAEAASKAHLRRQIRDPQVRAQLVPDYNFGCKRPTFSNDYYRAFDQPNVHLQTTSIARIEVDGIVTADGERTEIDTLVLATGFNMWDKNFPAIEIIGRDGRDLGKWWRDTRFQAYEGITIPHFPNLINLASPFSWALASYFYTIETQMAHMDRLFGEIRRRNAGTFEVTEAANAEFTDRMTRRLRDSVFVVGDCTTSNSYYFDSHGKMSLVRPTTTYELLRSARVFPLDAYIYA